MFTGAAEQFYKILKKTESRPGSIDDMTLQADKSTQAVLFYNKSISYSLHPTHNQLHQGIDTAQEHHQQLTTAWLEKVENIACCNGKNQKSNL